MHTKRCAFLKKFADFFSEFSRLPFFVGGDVAECIENFVQSERYSLLSFLDLFSRKYFVGCDVREIWFESVKSSREYVFLDSYSKERLLCFSEIFGKYGKEEFSCKCDEYAKFFSRKAKEESEKGEKTVSLYMGLSVFAAAVVFIILI